MSELDLNKFIIEPNMVKINLNSKELKIGCNMICYLSMRHHLSVGISSEIDLSNDIVLDKINTKTFRHNPKKEGFTGGDNASKIYTFKSIRKGEVILEVKNIFRGRIKDVWKVKIIVI